MSELANKSRMRDWQKARLTGFHIDTTYLTPNERLLVHSIKNNIQFLIEEWDKNTYILANKPIPKYKCEFCGRRSNISHKIGEVNYCLKHYKINTEI